MKLKLPFLLLFICLSIVTVNAQSFECRVENETFPSATTYEFDVKLYATGATTTWEYATGTYYINMNSAFRNAGTITASIVAGSSELNATQIPTSVTYQATNNYVIVAAKTPPGAGAGSIITQSGVRVVRMKLTNTANFSTTAAPNLAFRWATPNINISAYVGGLNTPIANNTVTAGQKNCKTPNYWNGTSWNKGTPTDTTDAVIFAGTYSGALNARTLTINVGANYNQNGGNLVLTFPIRNFGTINGNYLIQSQSGPYGIISPSGNYYVGADSIHKFVFTPIMGYKVDSVLVNGILVDSTSSYTFKNVSATQSIRVTFKLIQYNINAQTGSNGQISSPGNTMWNYGNTLRYTFMPNTGYLVDSVIVNNVKVDSLLGYTFSNLSSNQTIRVTFKPIQVSINAQSGLNGQINPSGNSTLAYGDSIRYTFTPNYGYELDSLIVNGIKISNNSSYTFKNVLSNQSIQVTFKPIQTLIFTDFGANGQINPVGMTIRTLTYGNSLRFVFNPNTGYLVDSVIVNGNKIDSLLGYTFSNIITSQRIRVTFKPIQITINAIAGSKGQISPIGSSNLIYGNTLRYVITPSTGYIVDSVFVNGIKVDSVISYTFSNVISNQSIRVTFKPIEISINSSAGANGNISKTGTSKLIYGDSLRINFTPNYGYTIDSIIINGIKVVTNSSYLFMNILVNQNLRVTFKPIEINIITDQVSNGLISPSGITKLIYGNSIRYTFIPSTGYKVDSVYINFLKVDSLLGYTFSNVITDQIIRVKYKPIEISINSSSGINGSISKVGSTKLIYGDSIRYNFTPNYGYELDSLIINGIKVANSSSYTFKNVLSNQTIHVTFKLVQVTINAQAGINGQINPSGNSTLTYGDSIRYSFTPNIGYELDSLIINGIKVTNSGSYIFKNLLGNQTIRVTFKRIQVTINAMVGNNGQISPIGTSNLTYGNTLRYVITPNTGYMVDSVSVNGIKTDSLAFYTFSNLTSNQIISVTFKPIEISINSFAGVNGNISKTGITKLIYGDSIRYNFTPNYGYELDSLIINGIKVTNSSSYTFKNVLSNQTIRVTFKLVQVTINAQAGINGQINPSGISILTYGDSIRYSFTPNIGYELDSLIINGIKVTNSYSYIFKNLLSNQNIRVTFKRIQVNISAQAGSNGQISPIGISNLTYGNSLRYVITPNTGYLVDSVSVNGIKTDSLASYTFSNLTTNQIIRVTFKPIEISINSTAGANGNISKMGITKLIYGDSLQININPSYGFQIDSIAINGIKVVNSTTYLFKNVLSNQSIWATFKPIQSTIYAKSGINGQISSLGSTSILYGNFLKYFFIPNTGYKVDSVVVNGVKVDSTTSYTFANVITEQSIRVTFTPIVYTINTQTNLNGTTNPSGNVSVIYGNNQRIVFTPNTNYYVDSVLVDGIPVDSIVGYTFSNVTADHNLRVVYTLKYNVASVSQAANSNQYIAYQTYARNNAGASLNNKSIQVKFSLLTDSINGSVVYAESHSLSTNAMGLFTAEIGNGTPIQGTWQGINWSASKKYLKTEIDMGSGWVNMGTQQLLAVPYAIHSNTSSKSQTLENANLPVFNTNAAAINAGLLPGQLYRTTSGVLQIVY
jgi:hypothetical protein